MSLVEFPPLEAFISLEVEEALELDFGDSFIFVEESSLEPSLSLDCWLASSDDEDDIFLFISVKLK